MPPDRQTLACEKLNAELTIIMCAAEKAIELLPFGFGQPARRYLLDIRASAERCARIWPTK